MQKPEVGIIGAGNVGGGLARSLVDAGYMVKMANSRGPQSLQDLERQTGAKAVAVTEIAHAVDFLILAIPLANVLGVPSQLTASLPKTAIVIDTGNYIPQRDGAIAAIEQGLPESEWVAQHLGAPVVKAFNNTMFQGPAVPVGAKRGGQRVALPVCADDPVARARVMKLVEDLGFSAFDGGSLADSWRQQPGQPAYATDANLAQLPRLLARADRQKAPGNRDRAMKLMAKLPANFPSEDLLRAGRLAVGLDSLKPGSWAAMAHLIFATL